MPPRKLNKQKRIYPVQIDMTKDEDEYVSRKSFQEGMSKSKFILKNIFNGLDIKSGLERLRNEQNGIKEVYRERVAR